MSRALTRFAAWFASRGGVVQTAALVLGLCVFEAVDTRPDPHGFWLLYWLTVYSAVTQPVLAFCSRVAAEKNDADLRAIKDEEDAILAARCPHCQG